MVGEVTAEEVTVEEVMVEEEEEGPRGLKAARSFRRTRKEVLGQEGRQFRKGLGLKEGLEGMGKVVVDLHLGPVAVEGEGEEDMERELVVVGSDPGLKGEEEEEMEVSERTMGERSHGSRIAPVDPDRGRKVEVD